MVLRGDLSSCSSYLSGVEDRMYSTSGYPCHCRLAGRRGDRATGIERHHARRC